MMAEERVIQALERLVSYVARSSAALRALGRPTDTQLAYGGGALEMLRDLGLITQDEMDEWFARVHEAAGGDDEHPLISIDIP
jgi:hypothetical protein